MKNEELYPNLKALFKMNLWEWCLQNKEEAIKLGLLIELKNKQGG